MELKKSISIGDKSYFSTFIWKRVLRKDLEKIKDSHNATIPLYSANVHKPFWFVESSNISDFSSPFILWWIDGDFDFSIQESGGIFATTDHCGCIKILDRNIYPWYLLYVLRIAKTIYNFDRSLRSNLENISKIEVSIPVKENWEFDLGKQKEVAEKYEKLEKIKDRIRIMKEDNENYQVEIKFDWKVQEKLLKNIFDLSINTNASFFTKGFVDKNRWNIPVFSASKNQDIIWYWYIKDNLQWIKYFENCLTWNIDGSIGKAFYRDWRFSLSEKVIPLILFDDLKSDLDINFLKYSIEIESKKEWFWFSKKAWKWRIKDILLKIPVRKNWEFDLEKQKEIAQKYEKIEKMKNDLIQELEYLESVKVEI